MCGIVGMVASADISFSVIDALQMLEYRGYDSSGIALLDDKRIVSRKALGEIKNLKNSLRENPMSGTIAIGHTRWATHGVPEIKNTHPMITSNTAVVHNGIISNYKQLKEQLIENGYVFNGDTDSEVIPNLIDFFESKGNSLIEAILLTVKKLEGSFALGIISRNNPDLIIAVKNGSPLVIGLDIQTNACYLSSDPLAIATQCKEITYMEDGQIAILERDSYKLLNFDGSEAFVSKETITANDSSKLGQFPSFMLKEIYEQPELIVSLLAESSNNQAIPDIDWYSVQNVTIIACGTSMYAGCIAKHIFESFSDIRVSVEIASEFAARRKIALKPSDLFIFVSQSGETADTLAALKVIKKMGGRTLGLINSANSSMSKLVDQVMLIKAGVEISVAATKTFLAQIASFIILMRDLIIDLDIQKLALILPSLISKSLKLDQHIAHIAQENLLNARNIIIVGRGISHTISLEGALKIKELVYIPAEGIAAGELKHGSIALIDEKTPVIVMVPEDQYFSKMISSINEIKARSGKIILISGPKAIKEIGNICDYIIEVPNILSELEIPFVYTPVLQLLAYHMSSIKGYNVDKPRNLAKSVTVE